jgi:hypothetical protein
LRSFASRTSSTISKNHSLKNRKEKKPSGCAKFLAKASGYLNVAHMVLLMRMALVDFMIPIAINFYFLSDLGPVSTLNWLFSFTIFAGYMVLFIYGFTIIYKTKSSLVQKGKDSFEQLTKHEKKKLSKFRDWMLTRDNLKDDLKAPYKYLPEFIGLSEFICCFSLVFFYHSFIL